MILSYRWLNEFIDLPVAPDELAEVLTYLGLEVEQVTHYRSLLEHVVIGEVRECAPIAGTDHLTLTKTDVGGESLSIVCGAPNVHAGMKVAVMLPGAQTADGLTIKKTKLRGHESAGMLASERELGLAAEHSGIIEGDAAWKVGAAAAAYLDLPDTTYDVEITPNRPDYLAHIGVARDLGAKFRLPWRWPEYPLRDSQHAAADVIAVEIAAPHACPRYAARLITGVRIARSPFATRLRLLRCGTRPISNIVDATNLLMLEFGQPLHAFDLRFVDGKKIIVRCAAAGERFTTLDGVEHKLSPADLLIADARRGVALAGIMGGLNSEIRDDTQDVLIECAYFDPVHIRRTARTHGLGTESSRRFERGMDPNGVPRVADAAAALMQRLAGGEIHGGILDVYPYPITNKSMTFRPARAAALVGLEIGDRDMEATLTRLGCTVDAGRNPWSVTAPTWRPDLEREVDLIEEVVRVHGYDRIPAAAVSRVPLVGRDNPLYLLRSKAVDVMVGLGFHETLSVSMYTPDPRRDPPDMPAGVALKNPVTDDMLVMHGSLLPALVRATAANWQRGDRNLRLFEAARVFQEAETNDPRLWERLTLAAVITGSGYPQSWAHPNNPFDFYDLKGTLEVLSARLSLDNLKIICYDIVSGELLNGELRSNSNPVGTWGIWSADIMSKRDIDAPVGWFVLDLTAVAGLNLSAASYTALPRFPLSWRDLAVVVDEAIPAAELTDTIRAAGGAFLLRVTPFDVFRGEKLGAGKKSIALRLDFSHPERSLESAEVDGWMDAVIRGLKQNHSAELR